MYNCDLPVTEHPFKIVCSSDNINKYYPYLVDFNAGQIKSKVFNISPFHGRSIVVDIIDGFYTVIKGAGLTYFPYDFLYTGETLDSIWGFLTKESAIRDFKIGIHISNLGIRTNSMVAILELLDKEIIINGLNSHPFILQYKVSCPYRLCDIAFIPPKVLLSSIAKWPKVNLKTDSLYHVHAADVLLRNLSIMHKNNVLHNAISIHNYTFELELLDFELSRTPFHPYSSLEDEEYAKRLYRREFIQTLEIVNYIAFILKERLCNYSIKNLVEKYSLEKYLLNAK